MTALQHRNRRLITEESLLRAVNILADIVAEQGASFRPLYHQVRQQLAEFRLEQQADAGSRTVAALTESKVA